MTEDEHLIRLYGPGHVVMFQCVTCGWLRWRETLTLEPSSVTRTEPGEHDGFRCERCEEAARRAPELVSWVAAVIRHALKRATDAG